MRWFEIVWTYRGEEYLLARHAMRRAAHHDYRSGRARSFVLVHGGTIRLDECSDRPFAGAEVSS